MTEKTFYRAGNDMVYVSREDFEAWCKLVNADVQTFYNQAKIMAYYTTRTGVEVRLNGSLTYKLGAELWYGRPDAYNFIRVRRYWGEALNLMGAGKHGDETRNEIFENHTLLTGMDCK